MWRAPWPADPVRALLVALLAACTGGQVQGNLPPGDDHPTELGMEGGRRTLDEDDPADRAGGDGDADADADGDAVDPVDECPGGGGCDWFEQCGCGRGEACLPDVDGAPVCSPAGTADLYERCEQEQCRPGLLCLGDSQDRYACAALCDDRHACAEGECLWGVLGDDAREIARVCAVTGCDPLGGGGCPAGQACSLIPEGTVCALPGPTPPFGRCVWNEDCVAGASCMYAAEDDRSGMCLVHCDPYDGFACPQGQTCWAIDDTVGVCDDA